MQHSQFDGKRLSIFLPSLKPHSFLSRLGRLQLPWAPLQQTCKPLLQGGVNQLQKAKNCMDISWVQRFQVTFEKQICWG